MQASHAKPEKSAESTDHRYRSQKLPISETTGARERWHSTACSSGHSWNHELHVTLHIDIWRLLTAPAIRETSICDFEAAHGLRVTAATIADAQPAGLAAGECHKIAHGDCKESQVRGVKRTIFRTIEENRS
jgi:hypothetical protein